MPWLLARLLPAMLVVLVALAAPGAWAGSYQYSTAAGNATTYPWIDTSSGTSLSLSDNAVSADVTLPFSFTLGDRSFSAVKVATNGMLQFSANSTSATPAALPLDGSGGKPNIGYALMPLWDDYGLGVSGASIRHKTTGTAPNRKFTVTWDVGYRCDYWILNSLTCTIGGYAVSLGVLAKTATFQVQLHENGTIVYRYGDTDGRGGAHSSSDFKNPSGGLIGLEVVNADYTQYSFRSASISNGTTMVWTAAPEVLTSGQRISLESYHLDDHFLKHASPLGWLSALSVDSTVVERESATFIARPGLWSSSCWSFESFNQPGYYLRHYSMRLRADAYSSTDQYKKDATFCARAGLANSSRVSFESFNYPGYYIRSAADGTVSIGAPDGGTYNERATWIVAQALADRPSLLVKHTVDQTVYTGAAGELLDTAGHPSGPLHGQGAGTPLPTALSLLPALSGTPGTCGYATLTGGSNGSVFKTTGLPLSTTAGAKTTVAFWMYWNGNADSIPVGFHEYGLWFYSGHFGFNTNGADIYGISSSGLANGWHHVVAVFTNGSVTDNKLYIDGVAQTLTQRLNTPVLARAVAGSTLTIGGYGADANHRFGGRIDEVQVFHGEVDAAGAAALAAERHTCAVPLHHLELRHGTGTGLTCAPTTIDVVACADASCTTPYTGVVAGTLASSGGTVLWPTGSAFAIAAGTGFATLPVQVTSAGSTVFSVSTATPAPSNSASCNFGSPACTFTAETAGLLLSVGHHVSDSAQALNIAAVRQSDSSLACVPAFASVLKTLNLRCQYANPTSGTLPVRIGGIALNAANNSGAACDGSGRNLSLSFDATGLASTTLRYADVGRLNLLASYTGSGSDAGLAMAGSSGFISAPASLSIGSVTSGPIRAGTPFSATVTAKNASGVATPNFGRETVPETVTLALTRAAPTGTGTQTGSFSGALGSFTGGAATASNLIYGEVGRVDLSAALASGSYLGSGLTASGTTGSAGAIGDFIPNHFTTTVTQGCAAGGFTYAAQPFTATVQAWNALGVLTRNYTGAFAQTVTLSDAGSLGVGTLSGATLASTAFSGGAASTQASYAFTHKLTGPQSLVLRASNGLTGGSLVNSAGRTEGSALLRSGRLRIANAFGPATAPLQVRVDLQYWTGLAWLPHSDDACSTLSSSHFAISRPVNLQGGTSTATTSVSGSGGFTAGTRSFTLAAPTPAGVGVSVDLALNLGSTGIDQSCNALHPTSTGAGLPWLRSHNGVCNAGFDRDPAARASFGIFGTPEARRAIHVRDLY